MAENVNPMLWFMIGLVFLVALGWFFWEALGFNEAAGALQSAGGSAVKLQRAIDEVYTEAVEGNNPDFTKKVNVTLVQPKTRILKGDDPEWIIYRGFTPRNIDVIEAEISTDTIRSCDAGMCYGRVNEVTPTPLDLKDADKVEDFWLLSPCHAEVEVYWEGQVKLKFTKNLKKGENFCCGDNSGGTPVDSAWPEESDAFEGSAPQNACDWSG